MNNPLWNGMCFKPDLREHEAALHEVLREVLCMRRFQGFPSITLSGGLCLSPYCSHITTSLQVQLARAPDRQWYVFLYCCIICKKLVVKNHLNKVRERSSYCHSPVKLSACSGLRRSRLYLGCKAISLSWNRSTFAKLLLPAVLPRTETQRFLLSINCTFPISYLEKKLLTASSREASDVPRWSYK